MYSLDINFLKDRGIVPGPARGSGKSSAPDSKKMLPLYAGLAVGLLLPAAVGGLWLLLQNQTERLTVVSGTLDEQLNKGKALEQQIQQVNQETQAVQGETKALASVFNEIYPWSAILQDIRDRVPLGLQITTIEQIAPDAAAAAAAPPSPGATVEPPNSNILITGKAPSFDHVNDFLLTLQRSKLFNSDNTQIVIAELKDNTTQVELPKNVTEGNGPKLEIKLPKVVEYKIQTSLSNAPAADLLREWERKGAVGLVTRLRNLQNKGALQQ
ncbi:MULTISPECIES: PilN domain-containing protein [Cyanophyceae]|uniref:PilN domain-containing protein n=1 Tax=Cyanophyceae TaxID=3028117 RepID=UPI001687962B|nr:PilN domain-containing protein [Trichocoleus sp. FACHB-69]MBD1934296.1 PilN domain-containing protein [Trichocoleus sp. FACHB-69]